MRYTAGRFEMYPVNPDSDLYVEATRSVQYAAGY